MTNPKKEMDFLQPLELVFHSEQPGFKYNHYISTSFVLYCRLSHFDYVKAEDLEKIGMGKPAIRRLVDVVKKKRKKKSVFEKVRFY